MEVWLTKGLFGEKTEKIADGAANGEQALSAFRAWKNAEKDTGRYKIERYDRFLFGEDSVAVDFGDYSAFALITGEGAVEEIKRSFARRDGVSPAV